MPGPCRASREVSWLCLDYLLMALVLAIPASYEAVCQVPGGAASVLAGAETSLVRLCPQVRLPPHPPRQSPKPHPSTAWAYPVLVFLALTLDSGAEAASHRWRRGGRCSSASPLQSMQPLVWGRCFLSGIVTRHLLLGTRRVEAACQKAAEEQGSTGKPSWFLGVRI